MKSTELKSLLSRLKVLEEVKDNSIEDNLQYHAVLSRIKEGIKEKKRAKVKQRRGILNKEGVYFIINPSVNRMYIGRSINMSDRIKMHQRQCTNGIHSNKVLEEDYNVYKDDINYFYIETKEGESTLVESVFINYCCDNGIRLYNGATFRMHPKEYKIHIEKYRRELQAIKHLLQGRTLSGRGGVFSLDDEIVTREYC